MRLGSTAKLLAKCKLEYHRISECIGAVLLTHVLVSPRSCMCMALIIFGTGLQVFDGHCGGGASSFARDNLLQFLKESDKFPHAAQDSLVCQLCTPFRSFIPLAVSCPPPPYPLLQQCIPLAVPPPPPPRVGVPLAQEESENWATTHDHRCLRQSLQASLEWVFPFSGPGRVSLARTSLPAAAVGDPARWYRASAANAACLSMNELVKVAPDRQSQREYAVGLCDWHTTGSDSFPEMRCVCIKPCCSRETFQCRRRRRRNMCLKLVTALMAIACTPNCRLAYSWEAPVLLWSTCAETRNFTVYLLFVIIIHQTLSRQTWSVTYRDPRGARGGGGGTRLFGGLAWRRYPYPLEASLIFIGTAFPCQSSCLYIRAHASVPSL